MLSSFWSVVFVYFPCRDLFFEVFYYFILFSYLKNLQISKIIIIIIIIWDKKECVILYEDILHINFYNKNLILIYNKK